MVRWAALTTVATLLISSAPARAGDERPGPREKCPVCGMFVAKYPDWQAVLRFGDGSRAVFDGAKDLFKFWLEPERFLPSRRREQVASLFVTDYYSLTLVDARAASYVSGSDVYGPMGREDAEEFRGDHRGTAILAFGDVTPDVVRALGLTDLCLFTEASYTRHPSQADRFTPFQDTPGSPEHFPSGSIVPPPRAP